MLQTTLEFRVACWSRKAAPASATLRRSPVTVDADHFVDACSCSQLRTVCGVSVHDAMRVACFQTRIQHMLTHWRQRTACVTCYKKVDVVRKAEYERLTNVLMQAELC